MDLKINGKDEALDGDSITVAALLVRKNVEMPETVSVQLNGGFVKREEFDKTIIKSNDEIEFLYFMGGGR